MPQSSHDPAAEHHNQASHAHDVAAVAHGKADHPSAHELSNQDQELSRDELKHSAQLDTAAVESTKTETRKDEQAKTAHVVHPGLPL